MAVFEEPGLMVIRKKNYTETEIGKNTIYHKKKRGGKYLYHLLYPSTRLLEDRGKLIIIGYPD
jgi:hypothetical protein